MVKGMYATYIDGAYATEDNLGAAIGLTIITIWLINRAYQKITKR